MLIVVLLAGSCKVTQSSLKENTGKEIVVHNDVTQTSQTIDKTIAAENVVNKSTTADSVVTNTIDVIWSKPDSTGKQYPEKTTYRNETRTNKTKADVATNKQTKANVTSKAENTDNSSTKNKEASNKEETTITKATTPTWIIIGSAILSLGLLVLLYFVLRRFWLVR